MTDDLLVIIPTRGRPQAVPALATAWTETGATADLLFAIDTDDPHLVTQAAGYTPELKHLASAPQGVHHRVADPTRMYDLYRPRVSLEEGIARALAL